MNSLSLKNTRQMKGKDFCHLYAYPITEYSAQLLLQSLKKHESYGIFFDDICVGIIEIHDENEVGYRISEKYQNRGFAKWALQELVKRANRPLKAYVEKNNIPSIRVLEHCGFQRVEERKHTYKYTIGGYHEPKGK